MLVYFLHGLYLWLKFQYFLVLKKHSLLHLLHKVVEELQVFSELRRQSYIFRLPFLRAFPQLQELIIVHFRKRHIFFYNSTLGSIKSEMPHNWCDTIEALTYTWFGFLSFKKNAIFVLLTHLNVAVNRKRHHLRLIWESLRE